MSDTSQNQQDDTAQDSAQDLHDNRRDHQQDDHMQTRPGQSHTDVSHLVKKAHDAFDMESWGHPESEPVPTPKEQPDHIEMHEAVEHEPDAEVAEYVEQTKDKPDVDTDLQEHGVQATQQPVQYPKHETVKVPLTDDEIMEGKKMPITSSFRWLAEFCLYILHKAHIRLKVAHGKATRIFENKK